MFLKITDRHIREGSKTSAESCPIARALNERYPDFTAFAFVTEYSVKWVNEHYHVVKGPIPLSRRATTFVRKFDQGRTVGPLTIRLDIPEEWGWEY